jgi:hypothetical protein
VNHNTGTARERHTPGDPGSLLGDYLEFGCAAGASLIHTFQQAAPRMPWMRFFAFDSFQGLPKPEGIDAESEAREGLFACDEATFVANLRQANVDLDRVVTRTATRVDRLHRLRSLQLGARSARLHQRPRRNRHGADLR